MGLVCIQVLYTFAIYLECYILAVCSLEEGSLCLQDQCL